MALSVLWFTILSHDASACHPVTLLNASAVFNSGAQTLTVNGSHDFQTSWGSYACSGASCTNNISCVGFSMRVFVWCDALASPATVTAAGLSGTVNLAGAPFDACSWGSIDAASPCNPTSNIKAYPQLVVDLSTLCPGVTYEYGVIEYSYEGTGSYAATWTITGSFTMPGSKPPVTASNGTYHCITSGSCGPTNPDTAPVSTFSPGGGCSSDPNGLAPAYSYAGGPSACTAGTYTVTITEACSASSTTATLTVISSTTNTASTVCVGAGGVWNATTCLCEFSLPIQLSNFSGKAIGTQNELRWITSSEINNSHFNVQRSVNGSTFETIGRVFGVGNSLMESQYVFYDSKPLDNKNYYRLQQVDFNEKDSYSEIVIINRSRSSGEITIQPNPVTDNISYSFISNQTGEATVRILDMSGRTLLQQPKVLLEGNNTFEMDVQSLTKGIYMLQITEEAGNRQVQRFVKQ